MSASDSKKPLVSLLVPVYNREEYLAECVKSALRQTIENIEVVICDNASTDGTFDICEALAKSDRRVRIFRNRENIGPLANWARCIQEAQGVYAKLLFSDDLIYPSYLEQTLPFLQNDKVGMVFTAVEIGQTPGNGKVAYAWTRRAGIARSADYIRELLFSGNVPYSPGAYISRLKDMRRDLILEPGYFVGSRYRLQGMGPDLGLCLLTSENYPLVAHIPEALCLFRAHDASFTQTTNVSIRMLNYNRVRHAHFARCGGSVELRRWIAWSWLMRMIAEGRAVSMSSHLYDLARHTIGERPGVLDVLWGASLGMWPTMVRRSRWFSILRVCGTQSAALSDANARADFATPSSDRDHRNEQAAAPRDQLRM